MIKIPEKITTITRSIRLSVKVNEKLTAIAKENNTTPNKIISLILEDYLKQNGL